MKIETFETENELYEYATEKFSEVLKNVSNPVLGLATGSSPIGMYQRLISEYKKGEISFKNVKTFNLDEYYGLEHSHPQSYYHFMYENLFKDIDIDLDNVSVPSGVGNIDEVVQNYEEMIKSNPIDIQILGVGRNGHIAFNEPGTSFDSLTHKVTLDSKTREDNARFFEGNIDLVPTQAVTMGLATILKCKKIILIATGESKAEAIYQLVHGEISPEVPVTILRNHPDVEILIDQAAAKLL